MVPKQQTGTSFKSASDYLLHDKGVRTTERVEWVHLENVETKNAYRAWKEMAFVAMHAQELKAQAGKSLNGRKQEKPTYHVSLSWAKDEDPDKAIMISAGKAVLEKLGLAEHQALFVAHNDEPQPHLHLLVSRVDPETGMMNTLSHSKRKLSAWAMEYEFNQGQIRCQKRVENNRALEQGEKTRHRDPVIREAWEHSDSGKAFQAALGEQGYVLARGNKRLVVMDPHGKAINPARALYGVKAADIQARVADLDLSLLPDVEQARQSQQEALQRQEEPTRAQKQEGTRAVGKGKEQGQDDERERQSQAWEDRLIEAAIAKEESKAAREVFNRKAEPKDPEKVLTNLTRNQALFTSSELRAALKQNDLAPELADDLERDGKILRLHERDGGKATDSFTTPKVREQEQQVLDCAQRLAGTQGWQVDEKVQADAGERRTLDAEQRTAMDHALSPSGMTVVQGRAGTGKSHTIGAIREALQAGEYRVIGLAPTNTVAVDLQQDGFAEARTVHSLLWHNERQRPEGHLDRNTVLVVDEAAMLDTQVMDKLLGAAEQGGSKVVLVGDDRQLASVSRGGMFGAITDRLGSAEITRVRRQSEAWDRQAAEAFASGRFADGVQAYERHGRIHWSKELDGARAALVEQWAKDTQAGIGNRFVFAYTNKEVERLNPDLRGVEIARGRVDASRAVTVKTERFGTVELAQGDRVQFRSNDKPKGIVNGLLGTVQQAGPEGRVQVLADDGKEIAFSARDENLPEIQHGYAGTLYRGQGKTLDDAYLLHTHHWRDRPSYVAMTRARGAAKLFVSRDQARGINALAWQMQRTSDRGASLQFATNEELRRQRESAEARQVVQDRKPRDLSSLTEDFKRAGGRIAETGRRTLRSATNKIRRLGSYAEELDRTRKVEDEREAEEARKERIFGQQRRNIEETLKHNPPADRQERERLEVSLRAEGKDLGKTLESTSPAPEPRSKSARDLRGHFDKVTDPVNDNASPPKPAKAREMKEHFERSSRAKDNAKDQGRQPERGRDSEAIERTQDGLAGSSARRPAPEADRSSHIEEFRTRMLGRGAERTQGSSPAPDQDTQEQSASLSDDHSKRLAKFKESLREARDRDKNRGPSRER